MQQQKGKKSRHTPSQADNLDDSRIQQGTFPPAPVAGAQAGNGMQEPPQQRVQQAAAMDYGIGVVPMAANSLLGGSFGASF